MAESIPDMGRSMPEETVNIDDGDTEGSAALAQADQNERANHALRGTETESNKPDTGDDGKDWKAEADKWKALARKHETAYKQVAPAAQKLQELENAQKSETQRLQDELAEREVQLKIYQTAEVRQEAGRKAGLDPDLWEFITAVEPEEAAAQAKRLAARLALPEPGPANMRQGARSTAKNPPSANDILRTMAGYQ